MICVVRGNPPSELARVRQRELPKLRRNAPAITGKDITGYKVARDALWKAQHHKCCYCEHKETQEYDDVEHYRPKASADRRPGSDATHGYWWLAFTWENLLFACPSCNRSAKNDRFPLAPGGTPLEPEEEPPGRERPYLLDPAATHTNPVEHIQFRLEPDPKKQFEVKNWFARPRGGSLLGWWTIKVCKLNDNQSLVELRKDHVDQIVRPRVQELEEAFSAADQERIQAAFRRAHGLLRPQCPYVALTYDALCHFVGPAQLVPWGLTWPERGQVGLPAQRASREAPLREEPVT